MRRRQGGLRLIAAATAIAGIAACRQIVGIQDDPSKDLTATACGLPYGTTTCASCASASCCSESSTCAADPSCAPYASCFGKCDGDPKCWAQCQAQFPAAGADVTALSVCMATNCESQCNLTCGALAADPIEPDAAVACQSCIVNKVCDETRACARSSDCDAIERCEHACETRDCADECQSAHGLDPAYSWEPDGGTGGVWGVFSTASTRCLTACDFGGNWSCVGHRSFPSPTATTDTYRLWVKDYRTGTPIQGATVALCAPQDIQCLNAFATAETNAAGAASLPFQNIQNVSGQQGLGLNGFLRVTDDADGLVPNYYYWGFPLSTAEMNTYAEVLTLSERQQVWQEINVTADPSLGTVSVAVYDCGVLSGSAPGVRSI